jgi:hypothetical protein
MTQTVLDDAHAAMMAEPENDTARLGFYECLAEAELFLLLEEEATGDNITPHIFPVEGGQFVLVFDRESRLGDFVEGQAAFAAMSGRSLASLLAGAGIGIGVNLGVAPSSILIPAEAVDWLGETLGNNPAETEEIPQEVRAPAGLPEALVMSLDKKLATAEGLARSAYLVGVTYASGRRSHMLAFVDPIPGAEPALAQAAGEALTFSGIEAGSMDVAFFKPSDPFCASLTRVGLRFDLPKAPEIHMYAPSAPGMDPKNPPKLR